LEKIHRYVGGGPDRWWRQMPLPKMPQVPSKIAAVKIAICRAQQGG